MRRSLPTGLLLLLVALAIARSAAGDELPIVVGVEPQPLAAQARRVVEALDYLGEPLPAARSRPSTPRSTPGTRTRRRVRSRRCWTGTRWSA